MQKFNGRMRVMEKSLRVQERWRMSKEKRHFKSSLTHTASVYVIHFN